VQEQQDMINALKEQNKEQQKMIEELQKKITELER